SFNETRGVVARCLAAAFPPQFKRPPQSGNGPCRSNGKAKPATLLAEILARHGAHRQVAEPRPRHGGEPVAGHVAELDVTDMLVAEPLLGGGDQPSGDAAAAPGGLDVAVADMADPL